MMNSDRLMAAVTASLTMRGEPNQSSFALFQHGLERCETDRHGRDAEPVALAQ